jgi:exopolyphosphatase/guanosine-5'-triphosphate,3'-diphosphate pyrophosphatase
VTTPIVPRWEWRVFGERLGAVESRFASLTPSRERESDELYLLSTKSDETVKVRDGLMDVKHLELVNDDGLEQWRPVAKTPFPLRAVDVRSLLEALGMAVPPLARDTYSLEELLGEIVRPNPDLLAVEVHKERVHYTLRGCMAELTEVRSGAAQTRTAIVESEDAALAMALVRELGLDHTPNTSFPRGLKALVGFGSRRYAVLDVGTNSVKLHIGERQADGAWRQLVDRAEVTRLGEGLEEYGWLGEEPMRRTTEAITAMVDEARRHAVVEIAAVGTAGLRIARNGTALVGAVEDRCGVLIEIIPGEEEARLAYLGATSGLGVVAGSLVVFDTGGGSSQFTFGHDRHVDERWSVKVGAARLTERFELAGAVSADALGAALEAISADLQRLDARPRPDLLVGMGGAVTNLAAVQHQLERYDAEVVQGSVLELQEVDRQIDLYRTRTAEERRRIVGLQPKRAEVILAGACIVRTVMAKLGRESLVVSDRGLRHGLLIERFGR